jgi:hypothetical protein
VAVSTGAGELRRIGAAASWAWAIALVRAITASAGNNLGTDFISPGNLRAS